METRQQEKQLLPSSIQQQQQQQQQQQYKTQITTLCDALAINQEKREKMLAAYTGREKELVQNLQKQIQTKQNNTESHPSSLLLPAPSFGSDSLAYSIVTPPRAAAATTSGGGDSISSPGYNADPEGSALLQQRYVAAGGGSVDEYYYQHQQHQHQVMINNDNDQYEELGGQQDDQQRQQQQQQQHSHDEDATPTIIDMHRKLLYVLSHPELFAEAAVWQTKVDMGIDPSRPSSSSTDEVIGDGMTSFEHEFDTATVMTEDDNVTTTTHNNHGEDETKDDVASLPTTMSQRPTSNNNNINYYKNQAKLVPPLPIQIFASDAEVVLPQAYTANQLFGIERTTGIELEAAGGTGAGSIVAVCQLFQRWLALMPNGDHENSIDPPGVTVMRISGGRYRVTGAHRVVWRWMNKFSFQTTKDTKVMKATTPSTPAGLVVSTSLEDTPSSSSPSLLSSSLDNGIHDNSNSNSSDNSNNDECCADFDFGDLVTMTIVDVFETDADGKLLSYCPTFDNRAVHKTQESIERLRKGASMVNDHVKGLAGSPTGKAMNRATQDIGKMSLHAAWAVGDIVKRKIQEEFNKSKKGGSITEEEEEGVIDVDYDGDSAAVDNNAAGADGEKDISV
jgi:hypothetical protein